MDKDLNTGKSIVKDYTVIFDPRQANVSKLHSNDIDNDIKKQSEESYIDVVKEIVKATTKQLECQNNSKKDIRDKLLDFFMVLLGLQYVSVFLLLLFKGFISNFGITDTVIITFITSVFVETLGAVIIMINFAFESKQEIQALKILHGVIERYQKFGNNDSANKN